MAVLDATTLLHFLEPDARAAMHPASGEPVPDAKDRIEGLVAKLQKAKEPILVPTPVLSEVRVRPNSGDSDPASGRSASRGRNAN